MAKSERAAIGLFAALLLATAFDVASAVDHAKFRTCQQTGFCRRHLKSDKPHPYVVAPNSLTLDGSVIERKVYLSQGSAWRLGDTSGFSLGSSISSPVKTMVIAGEGAL